MDFKVAGTHDGITAIQMDLKISGLTPEMIKEALAKTHKARDYILDEVMLKAIAEPREELSKVRSQDDSQQQFLLTRSARLSVRAVRLSRKFRLNAKLRLTLRKTANSDRYLFRVLHSDKCKRAIEIINTIAVDPEPGAMYLGKVTRIMDFGAFVEIAPGKEGLVHISQLDVKRTENVTDVVNVGDIIRVKVMEIDDKGRLNLSRRQVLIDVDGLVPENDIDAERAARPRRPHNDRRGGFNRNNRK